MAYEAEKEPAKPVPTSTAVKIRKQLSGVLTSEIFLRSERFSRFLRYVVERMLEGRGEQTLKSRFNRQASRLVTRRYYPARNYHYPQTIAMLASSADKHCGPWR